MLVRVCQPPMYHHPLKSTFLGQRRWPLPASAQLRPFAHTPSPVLLHRPLHQVLPRAGTGEGRWDGREGARALAAGGPDTVPSLRHGGSEDSLLRPPCRGPFQRWLTRAVRPGAPLPSLLRAGGCGLVGRGEAGPGRPHWSDCPGVREEPPPGPSHGQQRVTGSFAQVRWRPVPAGDDCVQSPTADPPTRLMASDPPPAGNGRWAGPCDPRGKQSCLCRGPRNEINPDA